jgi:tRNA(fMet)-specific endonuclease VapC
MSQKIRVGTQDLKIAAITLSHQATIVTRNYRDFSKVLNLRIEDWSI